MWESRFLPAPPHLLSFEPAASITHLGHLIGSCFFFRRKCRHYSDGLWHHGDKNREEVWHHSWPWSCWCAVFWTARFLSGLTRVYSVLTYGVRSRKYVITEHLPRRMSGSLAAVCKFAVRGGNFLLFSSLFFSINVPLRRHCYDDIPMCDQSCCLLPGFPERGTGKASVWLTRNKWKALAGRVVELWS